MLNEPSSSDVSSTDVSISRTRSSSRRFALATVCCVMLVALAVRAVGWMDDPPQPLNDPAIRNIVTLIAVTVAGLVGLLWFCLGSHYARRVRIGVAALSVSAFIALVTTLAMLRHQRVLSFSGSLVPQLATAHRETPRLPSESLSNDVDLGHATPNDFPQFLGPDRNGLVSSRSLARNWDSHPPREIWRRSIGAGWSSFAVVANYAVTLEQRGNQECVVCYTVDSGQPLWLHSINARHDTALGGIGPRSTPTIHDGRVYTLGATGVLQCLSGNGQLVWHEDLRKRYGVSSDEDEQNVMFGRSASPLIVDSLVIVPGGGPQGKAKNLVALDRARGELVWESECRLPDGTTDQIAYASPTRATLAGRDQILIVNESSVSGHDPQTGQQLWFHPWPGRSNGNASVSQAVSVDANRVLLTKGYGGGAELLELTNATDGSLQVNSVWKVARVLQTKFSNVVVKEGHAWALSEGILECVALESGKRRWKSGRYGHGQILGAGDLLLILAEDGQLHLVEMNPDKFLHLGSIRVLEGKSWNNLCLTGAKLLLRNAEEAVCLQLQ